MILRVKRVFAAVLSFCLLCGAIPALFAGAVASETFFVNSVNGTRWADLLVVYKDRATTLQNQWGYNAVVNAENKVEKIILGGDAAGADLAIPEGGMVVSATGTRVDSLKKAIKVGSYVYFDEYSSRVMVSGTKDYDPYYSVTGSITGFNSVRAADTFIVYDSGETTMTNEYGYEVCVSSEGYVISAGGNNNAVPSGGFVVSAISPKDIEFLKMYGVNGSKIKLDKIVKKISVTYAVANNSKTVATELAAFKEEYEAAKAEYAFLNYTLIDAGLSVLDAELASQKSIDFAKRNEQLTKIKELFALLCETPAVELRSAWYSPLETTDEQVDAIVLSAKNAGLNQLCLGLSNGYDTLLPLDKSFPFSQKAELNGFDILSSYATACKKYGIELVICAAVFYSGSAAITNPDWTTKTNKQGEKGESEYFFSPASEEFCEYYKKYVTFLLEHYDIDGLQLDYIRYPYCDGSLDYGYDDNTKTRFTQKYNLPAEAVTELAGQTYNSQYWGKWVEFKTSLVTDYVSVLSALVKEKRPDIQFTAAVAADTVDYYYMQNSADWVAKGYVDGIYPMAYGESIIGEKARQFCAFTGAKAGLYMGCGAYQSYSCENIQNQVLETRKEGADGIAFFELSAFSDHGYAEYLKNNVFALPALSPTADGVAAVKAQLDYTSDRINEVIYGKYSLLDTEKAGRAASLIETALQSIGDETPQSELSALLATLTSDLGVLLSGTDARDIVLKDMEKAEKIALLYKGGTDVVVTPIEQSAVSEVTESKPDETSVVSEQSIPSLDTEISKPQSKVNISKILMYALISLTAAGAIAAFIVIIRRKKH